MQHLYLHVPFCRRRCTYCDFSIAVRKRIPAREYVDAVVQELRQGLTDPGRKPGDPGDSEDGLETIYFGGGTPSLLPPDALATLLTSLRDRKSTRLNSSHLVISYAVFCLKKKTYR